MKTCGEELYTKVLAFNQRTQAVWFAIREQLADLRVEITTEVAEAASIPWELMRDPEMNSPVSLRVKSFVRVQSNPNIAFIPVPAADDGRVRLLYVGCRPGGAQDVGLRAIANRLLQGLGPERARFHIKALRPPTFEQLQRELGDAKEAGRPYHVVHFDGHGIYADLKHTILKDWLATLSHLTLGGAKSGKHGYLLFEHSTSEEKMRPVNGHTLGQLLHDTGVPILVLNACQSAMHEAVAVADPTAGPHDEIRAIGSLAQAVVDQGISAVLGMRYSVYVVTAAQYVGELYKVLAKGRNFGQAASEGRKHLQRNPDRWVGLQPRPLQDWFVPVVYEAMPIQLFPATQTTALGDQPELDPAQRNQALLRYVPDGGFIGRDETLLALDRAFDTQRVVLLHAYAGQGKTTTAVEFARWYALTGGLGERPFVFLASFESHTDLDDLLNQIGQPFAPLLDTRGTHWNALNDTAKRITEVRKLFREFPVLWIWDNVESVAGFPGGTESQLTTAEQNDLRDFLKQLKLDDTSKVRVLLTSRRDEHDWLGGIPHRIEMPRMSNSDAANLALSLGTEKKITHKEIADWQPLLDYCHGNPLTLRVLVGQAVRIGLRGKKQVKEFVEAVRSGEQAIEDVDEKQGRDKSLGASLDYGFRHSFKDNELPVIALLHLFQSTVIVDVLQFMGRAKDHSLPELIGKTKEQLTAMLQRARDIGLLTQIGPAFFTIHPALPWFLRQLFARQYDGQAGRSGAQAALRAWVEAVGGLGNYYHDQFNEGHRGAIRLLELEEANLLHARRLARHQQWWHLVIPCMQGLDALYDYQGRSAEWSRLVGDIVPDYCTPADKPVAGREEEYSLVMEYRVGLAQKHERDLPKAAALQDRRVAWNRQQAANVLALPPDVQLDAKQRNALQMLSSGLFTLGQILVEKGEAGGLTYFQESFGIDKRIGNKAGLAITEFTLGHAYMDIPSIRDLDAAEAAYKRSMDLHDPHDDLGRSVCIKQIGMVHHVRFNDAQQRQEPEGTLLRHAQATEKHYLKALQLCPKDAFTEFAAFHSQLGSLYAQVGQLDKAREHFEKGAQHFDDADNHLHAGRTRYNMALMYAQTAMREAYPPQQRDYFRRAEAYAKAALCDFRHYQGHAAAAEADTQGLLGEIKQALATLPQ